MTESQEQVGGPEEPADPDQNTAERVRKCREKARASFLWVKYARGMLEEEKSGTLQTTEQELEEHCKDQLGDSQKGSPLGSPGHVPHPPEPCTHFDTSPPKWPEVKQVVERARAASAPGPRYTL